MNGDELNKLVEIKEKTIDLMEEFAKMAKRKHYNRLEILIALTILYNGMREQTINDYGEEYIQEIDKFINEGFEDVGVRIKRKGDFK